MTKIDATLKIEKAKSAVRIASASLDPKTAPKFSKETIEAEREKAKEGLAIALELLKTCQGYLLAELAKEKEEAK
jgi:hypothetical protein